mgnify:CR=1 FL=1
MHGQFAQFLHHVLDRRGNGGDFLQIRMGGPEHRRPFRVKTKADPQGVEKGVGVEKGSNATY